MVNFEGAFSFKYLPYQLDGSLSDNHGYNGLDVNLLISLSRIVPSSVFVSSLERFILCLFWGLLLFNSWGFEGQ
jgi:hypothetical protein